MRPETIGRRQDGSRRQRANAVRGHGRAIARQQCEAADCERAESRANV